MAASTSRSDAVELSPQNRTLVVSCHAGEANTSGASRQDGVPRDVTLFSYGGSSVLTIIGGIGLLMNVSMRRFHF